MERIFAYILAVMLLCGACLCKVKGEETGEEAAATVPAEQLEEQIPQQTSEEQIPEENIQETAETAAPEMAEKPEEKVTEPETAGQAPVNETASAEEAQCEESPAEQIPDTETVNEETFAEDSRTAEVSMEDSLTENTSQEESLTAEIPAEESSVQSTQSEETAADEASGEEEPIPVVLNLRPDNEAQKEEGIWRITVSDEAEIIAFVWEDTPAGQYRIRVTDTEEKTCEESILSGLRWEPETSQWTAGEIYTLYLTEICGDGIPAEDSLLFRITVTEEPSEADSDPDIAEQTETEAAEETDNTIFIEAEQNEAAGETASEALTDAESVSENLSEEPEEAEAESGETARTGRRKKNTVTKTETDTAEEAASEAEIDTAAEETTETSATKTAAAGTTKKAKAAGTKKAAAARRTTAKKTASAAKKTSAETAAETEKDQPLTLDTLPDSPVSRLTAGGEALNILLNEGEGLFSASLTEGNALNLIPVEEAVEWQAEVSSLVILQDCGITSLSFTFGDQVYRMDLTETTAAETESETAQETTQGSAGSAAFLPEGLTWCLNENGLVLKWEGQTVTWNIAAADTLEADKYSIQ